MKARKWMLGTAAAALVAATPLAGLPQNGFISTAAAATDVSVNVDFNLFYDRLGPYGDWVSYESAYVWVPTNVSADWRPYTRGHWVYTREYGWLWASDEPFGWATYHYGRWGFAEDIGWYWVPAKRWAPAWVAWRRSDDYLAWAPLPPDDGVRVSVDINIDVDRVPQNYWVAVESNRFLDRDIAQVAVYDTRIIEEARPVGTVVVQNNTVINNVVEVNYVEKATKQRVAVREARSVDNPDRTGKLEGNAVDVFNADVSGDQKTMKPKKAREAREVIEERKTRRVTPPEETTGTVPGSQDDTTQAQKKRKVQPEDTTGSVTKPTGEDETVTNKKRKVTPEETTGSTAQPSVNDNEQAATKKKRQLQPEDTTGSVKAPAEEQQQPPKRKKKLPEDESGSLQQQDIQKQQQTNQQRKKKLPVEENAAKNMPDEPTGSVTRQKPEQQQPSARKQQREEQPGQKQKKQKKCDPSQQDCG